MKIEKRNTNGSIATPLACAVAASMAAAASASSLYARNLFNFIETMVDKTSKALAVNWDDELVKATALTRDGAVIHPNFQPKSS